MMTILFTVLAGVLFSEFSGYVIHTLLHSQKIEYLSRNHMIHHLVVYGPTMQQRPGAEYLKSVNNRSAVLGIGLEWIAPILVILGLISGTFYLLEIGFVYFATFTATALGWGYFLFGYMHDNMHLKNFWMERNPILKNWFMKIRRLHDIHHLHIDDSGKMNVNYGICFFGFDRIFGTYRTQLKGLNRSGLEKAHDKYKFIFEPAKAHS